ncbi:calcium-binding protein [Fuchsiella alkaliacetigena]|uniref:calcium-binding protein n=1 Tax=Fuchsiella alkaliacetigena TaxID=957042 RepID=UPI00200AF38A|nr:calcium-binding protein [Fuchsiella alkaliacetigena]MCK8825902.1 calcium-binding protein [Fuchsiella alkaliacetigena]
MSIDLKIGDSVRVKEGAKCPDDEDMLIGGWQGRVSGKYGVEDSYIYCIEWDSLTLEEMPEYFIIESKEEGLDYTKLNLEQDVLEKVETRDSKEDVKRAIERIDKQYKWLFLGEQGKRINQVLKEVVDEGILEVFEVWKDYLDRVLSFPFKAEVREVQDWEGIEFGDKLIVNGITSVEDLYGVIVEVMKDSEVHYFPLCDLEATDKNSLNYKHVNDYAVWFANR